MMLELHLKPDPDFTSKGWGRRVVKAGGRWSAARGWKTYRFVDLPAEARELAAQLLRRFGTHTQTTVVVRDARIERSTPSSHVVHYVRAGEDMAAAVDRIVRLGEVVVRRSEEARRAREEAERRARPAHLRRVIASLEAQLADARSKLEALTCEGCGQDQEPLFETGCGRYCDACRHDPGNHTNAPHEHEPVKVLPAELYVW